jgi:hypothetical protein
MQKFHHVGVITDQPEPGEIYVADTKVYVTDPMNHPYRIEFLRFEPDSPVQGPLRNLPHMAFQVENLEQALKGKEVIMPPFQAMEGLRVAFFLENGAVFEYMEFSDGATFSPVD